MVVANAPVPAKTPHVHAEAIKAWADGHEIERFLETGNYWYTTDFPAWDVAAQYRIKQSKPKDKAMEALIVLSPFAGPMLYAAAPDEANCVLVFDGTTNKLIKAEVKSPVEASKRPSEALDKGSQWQGSWNAFKPTGEL